MWQNRSSLPTKQNNTRLFSHYPAPSLHSSTPPPSFVSLSLCFSQSLFSSPLLPAFYFAEVKLSPGVCQVSSDSLKVRGHASPGPVPVGSPISQNRLGRWDGQWEWQGGQFHGFRGEQMALGVGFFVHHCFSFASFFFFFQGNVLRTQWPGVSELELMAGRRPTQSSGCWV